MTFEDSMKMASEEIMASVRGNIPEYFLTGDGLPVAGKVTSRSGGLLDSLMGGAESVEIVDIGSDMTSITIGSRKPYAALIAKGGVRNVTEKMRRFFWHKYFTDTGSLKEMWKRLRFKNIIKYLPRPYLVPPFEESLKSEIPEILKRHTINYLRLSIQEIITGTPRAVPLGAIK